MASPLTRQPCPRARISKIFSARSASLRTLRLIYQPPTHSCLAMRGTRFCRGIEAAGSTYCSRPTHPARHSRAHGETRRPCAAMGTSQSAAPVYKSDIAVCASVIAVHGTPGTSPWLPRDRTRRPLCLVAGQHSHAAKRRQAPDSSSDFSRSRSRITARRSSGLIAGMTKRRRPVGRPWARMRAMVPSGMPSSS